MSDLPHRLDRTVVIRANRETVFSFFTDSDRWASWWGAGSTVGSRPGEPIYIRYPGGVEAAGEIVELEPPARIVFTYGFVSGNPIPAGASLATITLEPEGAYTRLHLAHEFADAATRDHHIQGWRYQLSVFANAVANHVHRDVDTIVDGWFSGWAEIDDAARERRLAAISRPDITFHDRYSAIDGLADLTAHIGAYHQFMPNVTLARRGDVRHCQGVVLADWAMTGADGKEHGAGTNVFQLGVDGTIESVTGLWVAQKA
jgi:uncharacterized protein YndB with AHSA1/START domain